MEVTHNDIVNALAKAEDVAYLNAQSRSNELSNGCKPSKADNDKAIEIESWIQLLTRAKDNTNEDTCLEDDITWEIIQNVNELYREVDCTVSRTYSRSSSSGGGGNVPSGYVERVLGVNVDNSNPSRPVIEIFVDPLTISGDGTQADPFSAIGGGGGATNLGYTASPTDGTVTSSTGTDATLPLADGTNAGLLKPSHFSVLENGNQADGYVGTDANNEMLSGYYIEQLSVVAAQTLISGSDLVSLKAYLLDDADGGGRIIKVLAAGGVTNQFYQYGIDATTGEIGVYDITTDVFTPIVSSAQTLAQTLVLGNTSGANDIEFDATQGLLFANTSRLREGTIDAGLGGLKGIAQICGAGYELKWENGRLYVMGSSGNTIRQSLYNFTTTPTVTDDSTKGYAVGSLWTLDDGTVYICSDATLGAAVWAIGGIPDLQQVTTAGNTTTVGLTVDNGTESVVIKHDQIKIVNALAAEAVIISPTLATTTNFEIPNKAGGTETFAMLSDLTGLGGITKATAAGTDTYTTTIVGVTGYVDGDTYLIRFTNGNTTGATLNINDGTSFLGAKTLYRNNDGAIIGGDIWAGAEMLCVFNSFLNGFQCIGTSPNSLFAYVVNADSVTINRGQPVYAFGSTGNRMSVKLAYNTTDATSAQTYGLVYSTSIAANQKGIIIIQGVLDGLNLGGTWVDGDPVYLGTTAGTITKTKQYAPNHLVYLGVVERANAGNGIMYVRVQNGYEMDELHNVSAQTPANKDGLFYNFSTSLWEARQVAATDIDANVSNIEFGYLDGVTSDIQTQIDGKASKTFVESISLQDSGTSIAAATYTIELYANYAYTINELKIIADAGTCTANLKINSTSVTSISAVSVSNSIATATASGANTVAVGDKITLVTTSNSGLNNLQLTIKTTRI